MQQSKLESFIESFFNIGSGFIIAMLSWSYVITPLFGIKTDSHENFLIVMIFTVISIVRSFLWRRFFNAGLHKRIHEFVKRYFCEV